MFINITKQKKAFEFILRLANRQSFENYSFRITKFHVSNSYFQLKIYYIRKVENLANKAISVVYDKSIDNLIEKD